MSSDDFVFREQLEEFVSNQMAKVIQEFLASKFWDATTISGDSVNEDYFRDLAATYVQYCKRNNVTFKTKPHIAEMLRVMQQKVKIARVEVNSTFEADLKEIIEDKTAIKFTCKWKSKTLSKSRASSTINIVDVDNDQIRYQNILDGFQTTIQHCSEFFHEYTQAEEEALVQLIYHSERLFQEKSEIRRRCQDGEFIKKLISHSRHSLCHDPTAKHVISDAGTV